MNDYIVFTVGTNRYAVDVAWIERIIHVRPLTPIPNAHPYIEGMMAYENRVIRALNFRRMTGMETYEEELSARFARAEAGYRRWDKVLRDVAQGGDALELSRDEGIAALEGWLERLSTHDEQIRAILKGFRALRTELEEKSKEALWENDRVRFAALLHRCTDTLLPAIFGRLRDLDERTGAIAAGLQKMLIVHQGDQLFAVKVDTIEDMARIDPEGTLAAGEGDFRNDCLEISGVVELKERLVNMIRRLTLPTKEAA